MAFDPDAPLATLPSKQGLKHAHELASCISPWWSSRYTSIKTRIETGHANPARLSRHASRYTSIKTRIETKVPVGAAGFGSASRYTSIKTRIETH